MFGVALDTIWRMRNDWVFSQKSTTAQSAVFSISKQVDYIIDVNNRSNSLNSLFTGNLRVGVTVGLLLQLVGLNSIVMLL